MTLVLRNGWDDILTGTCAAELNLTVLRSFLPTQRWFASKDQTIDRARLVEAASLPPRDGDSPYCLATVEAVLADGRAERYLMPLGLVWGPPDGDARAGPAGGDFGQCPAFPRRRCADRCGEPGRADARPDRRHGGRP
ncbi:MAG: hypothetical protein WDN69_25365 [Aliidongia sp.]